MNCQDIGLMLDDTDIHQLDGPRKQAVHAHLATCGACAESWNAHMRLLRIPIPAVPEELVAGCRERAARVLGQRSGGHPRTRYIVLGSVVAVIAAAAAFLLPALRHAGDEAPRSSSAAEIAPSGATSSLPAGAFANAPAQDRPAGTDDARRAPARIRMLILPLQNNATDAATQEAIGQFYAAVLAELRKMPGLILLEPDTWTDDDEPASDIRLRLSGRPGIAAGRFMGTMRSNSFDADGKTFGQMMQSSEAGISLACTQPELIEEGRCEGPAELAARMVASLRTTYFPDAVVLNDLRSRILDPSLDPVVRLRSLVELGRVGSGLPRNPAGKMALRDAEIVAAAADLAAATASPLLRAPVWRAMQGVGGPQLMQALIAATRTDPDERIRMATADILRTDFAENPEAHSVLEERMREDSAPRVRALATRAILGEDAWKAYVRSSLKDAGRSADARIEAFGYQILHPSALPGSYGLAGADAWRDLLDEDAIQALADVLPRSTQYEGNTSAIDTFIAGAGRHLDHPAITGMLLDMARDQAAGSRRAVAADALRNRIDQPDVRNLLTTLSTDADPELRAAARRSLAAGEEAAGARNER